MLRRVSATGIMQIKILSEDKNAEWDRYVLSSPAGTFCHLSSWKTVLGTVYGLNTHYIYMEQDSRIVGVLPLAEVKSFIFGHTLISTPFCVYGGPCGESDEIIENLTSEAVNLARKLNVDYLEFRQESPTVNDWGGKDFYYGFKKEIWPDPDDNMKAVPRKQRAMIRKGIDNGLVSEVDDDVDRFYAIYSVSVRDLGTPVYPVKYFRALIDTFRDKCRILTVMKGNKPVSSVLSLYYKDTVMPYYGGGLTQARQLKAYDFMYWELMRRSCEEGIRCFDFGRSIEGTGSFSFKKNWGFNPEQLFYKQLMINAQKSPDFNPGNPKYRTCIKLWQKLPLPVANFIGPLIARNLG